ncbi:hypothetical protein Pcinc_038292 [Petrolisthes cinctipes]|uniref:Uncharacterized protein n=1 Tax=Petrolisthes cinctipes TaxID=88211 RepID=A0AAE1EKJ2_PETCI|nr:hypothetical protein Pcinc_038292 [Petrolisthes cinctipes]
MRRMDELDAVLEVRDILAVTEEVCVLQGWQHNATTTTTPHCIASTHHYTNNMQNNSMRKSPMLKKGQAYGKDMNRRINLNPTAALPTVGGTSDATAAAQPSTSYVPSCTPSPVLSSCSSVEISPASPSSGGTLSPPCRRAGRKGVKKAKGSTSRHSQKRVKVSSSPPPAPHVTTTTAPQHTATQPHARLCDVYVWSEGSVPDNPSLDGTYGGIQPAFPVRAGQDYVDYFLAFLDDGFVQRMCDETNKYRQQCVPEGVGPVGSRKMIQVGEPQQPSLRQFSRTLVTQLLQRFGQVTLTLPRRHSDTIPDRVEARAYLGRHYMEHLPPTGSKKNLRCCSGEDLLSSNISSQRKIILASLRQLDRLETRDWMRRHNHTSPPGCHRCLHVELVVVSVMSTATPHNNNTEREKHHIGTMSVMCGCCVLDNVTQTITH